MHRPCEYYCPYCKVVPISVPIRVALPSHQQPSLFLLLRQGVETVLPCTHLCLRKLEGCCRKQICSTCMVWDLARVRPFEVGISLPLFFSWRFYDSGVYLGLRQMQDICTYLEIWLGSHSQRCGEKPSVSFTLQECSSFLACSFLPGSTTACSGCQTWTLYVSRQSGQVLRSSGSSCTLLNNRCNKHSIAHLCQHPPRKGVLLSPDGREEWI